MHFNELLYEQIGFSQGVEVGLWQKARRDRARFARRGFPEPKGALEHRQSPKPEAHLASRQAPANAEASCH